MCSYKEALSVDKKPLSLPEISGQRCPVIHPSIITNSNL